MKHTQTDVDTVHTIVMLWIARIGMVMKVVTLRKCAVMLLNF